MQYYTIQTKKPGQTLDFEHGTILGPTQLQILFVPPRYPGLLVGSQCKRNNPGRVHVHQSMTRVQPCLVHGSDCLVSRPRLFFWDPFIPRPDLAITQVISLVYDITEQLLSMVNTRATSRPPAHSGAQYCRQYAIVLWFPECQILNCILSLGQRKNPVTSIGRITFVSRTFGIDVSWMLPH